jgi:hypothetical protein
MIPPKTTHPNAETTVATHTNAISPSSIPSINIIPSNEINVKTKIMNALT